MTALQGAVEATAPVSRLHEHQSFTLDDFPVPSGREEEWRFTPLHNFSEGNHIRPAAVALRATPPGGSPCVCASSGSCTGLQPRGSGG